MIDDGPRQIVSAVEPGAAYRDNTVFAIVLDCGRRLARLIFER